jgi:hypothetical protein
VSDSSTPWAERASKGGRLAIESVKWNPASHGTGQTLRLDNQFSVERLRQTNRKTAFPGDGCPLAGRKRSIEKSVSLH